MFKLKTGDCVCLVLWIVVTSHPEALNGYGDFYISEPFCEGAFPPWGTKMVMHVGVSSHEACEWFNLPIS